MYMTRGAIKEAAGVSDSTLRGILKRMDIYPDDVYINQTNREVYLYSAATAKAIISKIESEKQKRNEIIGKRKCMGTCGRHFPVDNLRSGLCHRCWIEKAVLNAVTMNRPDKNKPKEEAIRIALEYLSRLRVKESCLFLANYKQRTDLFF